LDDAKGGGKGRGAAEELILRTVAAHADSLLRTARRFSLCPDDAQDAYQRALEIFMGHAERLDPARAPGWLHVVVKREAQAIRRSRQKLVATDDVNLDQHEARSAPTPEERLASFDLIGRSAEALQRLKPQELRALWLRAQGHSYNDIGAMTGWSYTKVNRCLTEGRRSFLERYADIESGAECARWLPVISAMVDGEATSEQLVDLRPHLRNCPGCRATLRALQDSSAPLAAVLPIPLAVMTADAGDQVSNFITRVYELVAGGLHDRAATSFTKVQALVETTAAGKAAAIAGAAAAVAGGGYATVERSLVEGRVERPQPEVYKVVPSAQRALALTQSSPPRAQSRIAAQQLPRTPSSDEFERKARLARTPEFTPIAGRITDKTAATTQFTRASQRNVMRTQASAIKSVPPRDKHASPEFAPTNKTEEFGP
jgi:RNA polymerase sigma factor (sigma-70 family)